MCMRPSDILDSAVVAQGGHVNWLHDKLHCMIFHTSLSPYTTFADVVVMVC